MNPQEQDIVRLTFDVETNVALAELAHESFGSSSQERLKLMEDRLSALATDAAPSWVVVDLRHAAGFGAGLLGVLVRVGRRLAQHECHLAACGDRFGLLSTTALDRAIPTFDDAQDALRWCAEQRQQPAAGPWGCK